MSAVYVASAGERRQKVGLSSNPRRRVAALSGASGYPLTLAAHHEVADAAAVERMAHWLLREAHIYGEWFGVDVATADAAIVQAAQMIADGHQPPRREILPGRPSGGRPPLGNVATQVRLPKAVMERIDALLGANQRAKFIREAVENELKRREEAKP